jgi:hypothetical protein
MPVSLTSGFGGCCEYRGKLIRSDFRVLSSQPAHECTLAHRGKAYEANAGNTGSGDIEADTSAATSTATGVEELPLEFCKFCLQLP